LICKGADQEKKAYQVNEEKLITELKNATQVLRRQIPQDVVDVNTRVLLRNLADNTVVEYNLLDKK